MIELNKDNYEIEIQKEKSLPIIVDFWGPQCTQCLALIPHLEKLEKEYKGKIKFTKVDCSSNKRVALNFKVMGLPTILFFKNGIEIKRLTKNNCTIESIKSELEKLL